MEWLNYHHLYYFWTVIREGGITAAGKRLNLVPSTISSQISCLEGALDVKLFKRVGRNIEPTEMGQLVFQYADEIFSLGKELMETVRGHPKTGRIPLRVGVVDALPKMVVRDLLDPVFKLPEQIRLVCHENKKEALLAELALHEVDIVLSDSPMGSGLSVKAYNHTLGECGVTFFAVDALSAPLLQGFPYSLEGSPVLLPLQATTLREELDIWLESLGITPAIVGEFDDAALLKAFGQRGDGIFMAPTVIEDEIRRQYQVSVVGRTREVRYRFYAISIEKILSHPAVVAISTAARHSLFA
ncbi:MAG: LysR family transcriptional regulator [Desulfobulbaceae bacterium S3730MH12]|nr:MAG: LysR family transcriptional regulator [Desulfobulbaceae bacterium S5133MH15]OEU57322.1 MAG: LysR family transcriptional regulator [Desulfobulbaceae bacterium S3730MH12]OEU82321.1 MAG: LysR family transcriptional regulator [Desulfobulbaceae bacterium C00003063]